MMGIAKGRGLALVHYRRVMVVVVMVVVAMMHHNGVGARDRSEGRDANNGDAEGEEGLHNFC